MRRGNETWTEVQAADRLVLTDLVNGSMKNLGIISDTGLTRGEAGVFWTKPHPFPDNSRDLYYARAADGTVLHLGQVPENRVIGWSVEYQGTLYWFFLQKGFVRNGYIPGILMGAELHGAHIRTVLSLIDLRLHDVSGANMVTYRGELYCVVRQGDPSIPMEARQVLLARVHPGQPNPLEIVCKLPVRTSDFRFDQGFLYYTLSELERGLLAALADDDAGGRVKETLCRVPLPR